MPPPWLFWKGNLLTITENKGSFMELRGTTILAVRHKGHVALIGDGQVTMGQSIVMKHTAKKVRRMYKDQIVAGFAGAQWTFGVVNLAAQFGLISLFWLGLWLGNAQA